MYDDKGSTTLSNIIITALQILSSFPSCEHFLCDERSAFVTFACQRAIGDTYVTRAQPPKREIFEILGGWKFKHKQHARSPHHFALFLAFLVLSSSAAAARKPQPLLCCVHRPLPFNRKAYYAINHEVPLRCRRGSCHR